VYVLSDFQVNKALGCRIPIQPGKGYSLTLENYANSFSVPCILKDARLAVTPWESGYRISGFMEFSGYNKTIDQSSINMMLQGHKKYFGDIDSGKKDQETTYGWRPMTYDGLPLIDRSFALKNLMIAAGHNMVGMGMGPMTGKIVADIVGKETSKINLEPYKFRKL
jgi:D-amino-acid dehydrogenase